MTRTHFEVIIDVLYMYVVGPPNKATDQQRQISAVSAPCFGVSGDPSRFLNDIKLGFNSLPESWKQDGGCKPAALDL